MSSAPDLRTITDVAPLVERGSVSPVDLVRGCLAQIDARPAVNAFITRLDDAALAEAKRCEEEIAAGRYRGPLHGMPIAVKDLIDVAGTPTTSGSAVPQRHPAADAPVIARLRDAGAIIIGKTNLHEFAFGTTSEESAFGPVRNPLDESRSAGGSSGGSAAALVAGMCFGALGTDTGGSIRIPSAACGTVGLKPTFGEIPCDGVVPLSATLDHVGPMTRSVEDAALMFEALAGRQPRPLAPAAGRLRIRRRRGLSRPAHRARRARRAGHAPGRPSSPAAIASTRSRSTTRRGRRTPTCTSCCRKPRVTTPRTSSATRRAIRRAFASASRWAGTCSPRTTSGRCACARPCGPPSTRRWRTSTPCSCRRCQSRRPCSAPSTVDIDGVAEPVRAAMLRLTQLFNISGHPAVALPAANAVDGLPRGLQLVGRRGHTARLLAVAAALSRHAGSVTR